MIFKNIDEIREYFKGTGAKLDVFKEGDKYKTMFQGMVETERNRKKFPFSYIGKFENGRLELFRSKDE